MRQETNCLPISPFALDPFQCQRRSTATEIWLAVIDKAVCVKILVVDDSEPFRKLMAEFLVRTGFRDIVEADDFDRALEAYRKERPRITFVDMILPGKSGVDLTKAILAEDPKAVIIAMSSIVNKKMIRESLDAGAKDFILKPANEIAVSSVLRMWSD